MPGLGNVGQNGVVRSLAASVRCRCHDGAWDVGFCGEWQLLAYSLQLQNQFHNRAAMNILAFSRMSANRVQSFLNRAIDVVGLALWIAFVG